MIKPQVKQAERKFRVLDEIMPDEGAYRTRYIVFELKSLDEVVEAGSLFFWCLEHLSPILSRSAKLEGYELDEENEGVRVTLSDDITIPEKVWREFHVRMVPWTREMVKADDIMRNWMTVPMNRREDVLCYIAEQLARENNDITS